MNEHVATLPAPTDLRDWSKMLAGYRDPSNARSAFEIAVTVLPLVALWVLMWVSLDVGYWLCLLLSVPAAGFLVRLFMIQHDCGHGAFFRERVRDRVVIQELRIIGSQLCATVRINTPRENEKEDRRFFDKEKRVIN